MVVVESAGGGAPLQNGTVVRLKKRRTGGGSNLHRHARGECSAACYRLVVMPWAYPATLGINSNI